MSALREWLVSHTMAVLTMFHTALGPALISDHHNAVLPYILSEVTVLFLGSSELCKWRFGVVWIIMRSGGYTP